MSKLDEAEQRLQAAVSGLETAVRAVSSRADSSAAGASSSSVDLEAARARNAELEGMHATLAERLDGAIARLKKILED